MVESHKPVMVKEVLHYLECKEGGVYVDATLGDGGHTELICNQLRGSGLVVGIDWDEAVFGRLKERLRKNEDRIKLVHGSYTDLEKILSNLGIREIDGILFDLGASTLQLMDTNRGFSFHGKGFLDMRMDKRQQLTAKEIVNHYSFSELSTIFSRFGEERWAKRIAGNIVRFREEGGPIEACENLSDIVKESIPARFRRKGRHPSRKVFQALRLAVNKELDNISTALPQAHKMLASGGRFCIISYHSLEDRIVKKFFRQRANPCACPHDRPCICGRKPELTLLTSRAVRPDAGEIDDNPRARSARLRAACKV